MSDRIDEWMLGNLHEYAGKPLKHVAEGELPLDEADKARQEEATKAAAPLLEKLKGLLGDRVEDVRVFARLTDPPSCLAMSEWEMAPPMPHLLREAGQDVPANKPAPDIHPTHRLPKQIEADTASAPPPSPPPPNVHKGKPPGPLRSCSKSSRSCAGTASRTCACPRARPTRGRAWPCPDGRWPRIGRTCSAKPARTCRRTSRRWRSIPRIRCSNRSKPKPTTPARPTWPRCCSSKPSCPPAPHSRTRPPSCSE